MKQVYVNVGFRKLKGRVIKKENDKYVVELDDKSCVVVDESQIEGEIK